MSFEKVFCNLVYIYLFIQGRNLGVFSIHHMYHLSLNLLSKVLSNFLSRTEEQTIYMNN